MKGYHEQQIQQVIENTPIYDESIEETHIKPCTGNKDIQTEYTQHVNINDIIFWY